MLHILIETAAESGFVPQRIVLIQAGTGKGWTAELSLERGLLLQGQSQLNIL